MLSSRASGATNERDTKEGDSNMQQNLTEEERQKLQKDLEQQREKKKRNRKLRHFQNRRSRIAKYHAEVLELREMGASVNEITAWLRKKRIKLNRSSVHRYIQKHYDGGGEHA